MDSTPGRRFPRRLDADGVYHSFCGRCFKTLGTSQNQAALDNEEQRHECDYPVGPRMLMVGRDVWLMELRRRILERAGYTGDIVSTAEEARRRIELRRGYWLLVVCHTVPLEAKEELRRISQATGVALYELPKLLAPEKMLRAVERMREEVASC